MSKQLEIIVKARDEASSTFRHVGDSASGLGDRLNVLNTIMETGHGIHSMLRQARGLVTLFEVAPFGIDAFKAVLATLNGTTTEAATAQRELLTSLKEIPIVGRIAAEAAESLGTKLAHAFGKESTAELEADVKAKEDALKKFTELTKNLPDQVTKSNRETSLVRLAPDDAEIAKAKNKYQEAIEKLKPLKQAVEARASAISSDTRESDQQYELRQLASSRQQIATLANNAEKQLNADLEKLRAEREEKQLQRDLREIDEEAKQGQALVALRQDINTKMLAADNRLYESQQNALKASISERVNAISNAAHSEIEKIEQENRSLQLIADKGNREAQNRIIENRARINRINANVADQSSALFQGENAELAASRDKELREAHLASLRQEAAAGDVLAKQELERLQTAHEHEGTENALQAILHDENATYDQRLGAAHELAELKKAEAENAQAQLKADATTVQDAGLAILRQEASLGDHVARQQLKKLDIEKQYTDLKQKLLGVLQSENANEQVKAAAKKELAALDKSEALALKEAGKTHERQGQLADLQESGYLSGVSARAEQDKNDPVIEANRENTKDVVSAIGTLADILKGALGPRKVLT